jgi:hypothetical protein
MKMEQTQCSETSAIKHHTPENNPKGYTRHTEHGESLKSRTIKSLGIIVLHGVRLPAMEKMNKSSSFLISETLTVNTYPFQSSKHQNCPASCLAFLQNITSTSV